MSTTAVQPSCFGTHVWSATAPECVGGPDAGYEHPTTGAHARERCRWYQSCADVKTRTTVQPLIQPQQLLRQPKQPTIFAPVQPPPRPIAPTQRPPIAPVVQTAFTPRPPMPVPAQPAAHYPQYPQPIQPQPVAQPVAAQGYVPPHVAQMGPMQVPVSVQQPGAAMPHYLTNPEPIDPNGGTAGALGRTLARSAMKAIGHSVAAFFDHTPLKPHKPPESQ